MQIVAITDPLQLGYGREALIGIRVQGDVRLVADKVAAIDEANYVVMTAGSFDIIAEVDCRRRQRSGAPVERLDSFNTGGNRGRDVFVSEISEADL